MFSATRYALFQLLLTSVAGVRAATAADDASSVASEVQLILEQGWKPSQENYAAAGEHFERAKQLAPRDVRVPYAMALVSVQNRKFDEAAGYLDESLKNGNSLLPIRRVKIWFDIFRKNKEAAKADIRELVRQLSLDEALAGRTEYQEAARMLGGVMGYFAGPGSAQLPAADLAALNDEVDGKLKGPLATALAEGKTAATTKYAQFQEELALAHQDAKQRNETKLADDKQKNAAALAQATDNRAKLEKQYAEFQQQHQEEVQRKERELNTSQNQIANVIRLKKNLQDAVNAEKQKKPEQQNQFQIAQFNEQIRTAEDNQQQLASAVNQLKNDLNALTAQNNALLKELKRQQSLEQGLGRKSKELDKTASENDNATQALESKANSITTYTGVDLEQEKKRILETYKGK